jgi:hypothetical protein
VSSESRLELARRTVEFAWSSLPPEHKSLLESIGANHRDVVIEPLGGVVNRLLVSAGNSPLSAGAELDIDQTLGVWLPALRVVLINAAHPVLDDELSDQSFAEMILEIAWHEWGHALSIDRASKEDVRNWREYLAMSPAGISERIRRASYRQGEITHEIVAGTYATLMSRRVGGATGTPKWLHPEIHELMRRVAGWPD